MMIHQQRTLVTTDRVPRVRKPSGVIYDKAMKAFRAGQTGQGLSVLCDLVHAEINFKQVIRGSCCEAVGGK